MNTSKKKTAGKNTSNGKSTRKNAVDVTEKEKNIPKEFAERKEEGDIPTKKAISISIVCSVLSNILTDLLRPDSGWGAAINKVAELAGSIPFSNFVILSKENTSRKVTKKEYDGWINSILVAMVAFQERSSELREIGDEFDVSYEEIAKLAASRIIESAGVSNGYDYEELKRIINSNILYDYLQKAIPSDIAKKISKKMKI